MRISLRNHISKMYFLHSGVRTHLTPLVWLRQWLEGQVSS